MAALALLVTMVFAPSAAPLKVGATRLALAERSEREVARVARRFSQDLLSFDYRQLDRHLARVGADSTGHFKRQYEQTLGNLRSALVAARARSSGRVQELAVTVHADGTATAIVQLVRTISNATSPSPRSGTAFLRLGLVRTAAGWKVDEVGELQGVVAP